MSSKYLTLSCLHCMCIILGNDVSGCEVCKLVRKNREVPGDLNNVLGAWTLRQTKRNSVWRLRGGRWIKSWDQNHMIHQATVCILGFWSWKI